MCSRLVLSCVFLAVCVALATAAKQSRAKQQEATRVRASLTKSYQCQACKRNIPESEVKQWVANKVKTFEELEAKYWKETEDWAKKVQSGLYKPHMRVGGKIPDTNGTGNNSTDITDDEKCWHDPPAPRGYMHFPGQGNYKLYTKAEKWSKAQEICQDDGGDLAVVNNDYESEVLKTLIVHYPEVTGSANNHYVYIGAQRIGEDFITVFGDNIRDLEFNRWAPGEPYMNEPQHCVTLTRNAELAGFSCYSRLGFICENFNRELKVTYFD